MGCSFNCITITNAFHKHLDESGRKPKKIWVGKCSEFYNRSIKLWLQGIDTEKFIQQIMKRILLLLKNLLEY